MVVSQPQFFLPLVVEHNGAVEADGIGYDHMPPAHALLSWPFLAGLLDPLLLKWSCSCVKPSFLTPVLASEVARRCLLGSKVTPVVYQRVDNVASHCFRCIKRVCRCLQQVLYRQTALLRAMCEELAIGSVDLAGGDANQTQYLFVNHPL